ncbi:MAG: precorrin-4 C(11)-methyltransferase [Candidatus Omnitrophica bacterium]|nr:precorrin-4 C(11)-methyltransferase [Candidatus Omnitrophota bacterium]
MKIYFIGAGAGDPDLLTLKAVKIIKKAGVVIYAGSLVNKVIIDKYADKDAKIYNSAKLNLDQVCRVYLKQKKKDGIIARVHTGDTSLYSAIQEQMQWCDTQGIDYEVIPGVSSFCAASAALKQELTLPGLSQTVIITRISGKTKVPAREDLKHLANIKAVMIIFLSIGHIDRVVKKLMAGYKNKTPVAVVYKASWPDEIIIRGTLATIADKVKEQKIGRQALVIVGEALNKKNFKLSKLYDKNSSTMFRCGEIKK